MKTRFYAIALCIAMLLCFVACQNGNGGVASTTENMGSDSNVPSQGISSGFPTDRKWYSFYSYDDLQNAFANVEESEIFEDLERLKETKAFDYISVWGEALIHQLHEEGHVRVPYWENENVELDFVSFYTTGFSCYGLPQFWYNFHYNGTRFFMQISYPEIWYEGLCELEYPQLVERCHGQESSIYGKVGDFDFELRDMTVKGRVYECAYPSDWPLWHVAFMYDGLLVYVSAAEELPDEFFKAFYIE